MKTKMQKLSTRRLSDAPADSSLVRGDCGPCLNKEETLSGAGLKTVDNNPEESQLPKGREKLIINFQGEKHEGLCLRFKQRRQALNADEPDEGAQIA